jgi:GNAT superfamily N-acetyltransferase
MSSASEPELEAVGPIRRGTQAADLRPAHPDELPACAAVWRAALNDYLVRLGQREEPEDLTGVITLYTHLQRTDPDTFVVATRPDTGEPGGERIVAFAAAIVRSKVWYLSMLFVLPEEQGLGLGRTLLERVLPAADAGFTLATTTDSAQPISNALYARFGIVPRMPLIHLVGTLQRPETLAPLPDSVSATAFEALAEGAGGTSGSAGGTGVGDVGVGHGRLAGLINELDLELAGFEHPQDHRFLRTVDRHGFLYRSTDGTVLGYGYTSDMGRIGPVAVRDEALVTPVLGHLMQAARPRGAFALWLPGAAGTAITTLLVAGLRIEDFPLLIGWDRPFADLSRYLPISPGLP